MVTEAFATFDGLTQVCDDQSPPRGLPLENDLEHTSASPHEVVMETLFIKTTTALYEGCSSSILFVMLLLLNLSIVYGV